MTRLFNSLPILGWGLALLSIMASLSANNRLVLAQEIEESSVTAPAGTVKLSNELGGSYYVDAELLNRYQALQAQLQTLKNDMDAGRSTSESALKQLEHIEAESKALRTEIEATKTYVAAFQVYRKTTESTFAMADSQRVIVVGDNVKIRGWAGPGIKCVTEKLILGNNPPAESEFEEIQIKHEVTVPESVVGKTAEQRASDALEFRNSEAGKNMNEEQLQAREAFWRKQFGGFDVFADFQGQPANLLSIEGLTYQEGNRQVTARITSENGGSSLGSEWRRHVSVTIFVPPCQHLMVAGCLVKLDIEDVQGNLLLTTSQSRDRDYEGSFEVRNIQGDITIDQAPVRLIDQVQGNIVFEATEEFVNSGTRHAGGNRTAYVYPTKDTEIRNVHGNLQSHFLRTSLRLEHIDGTLDVINEFGDTRLRLAENAKMDSAMRVISECGEIHVSGPSSLLRSLPIYAHTLCGVLFTNLDQEVLEDVSFTPGGDRPQRGWSGLVTPAKERYSLEKFQRPQSALENAQRDPGLDLISKAGRVSILTE